MAHGADKFQLLEDRVSVKRLAKVIWTQVWLHNKWLDVTTNNCDSSFLDVKWKRRHRPQSRQTYAEHLVVRSAAEQQTRNQRGEPGNRPPPRNFQKHFVVVRYSNWLPLLWKYQLVAILQGSEKFDRNEQVKYLPGSQHIYWLPQRPSPPQHLSSARTRQKRRAREICTNFERRSCFARVSRTFDNSNRQSKTQILRMIINFPRSRSVGY